QLLMAAGGQIANGIAERAGAFAQSEAPCRIHNRHIAHLSGGQFHTHLKSSFYLSLFHSALALHFTNFTAVPFGSRCEIWNSSMNACISMTPLPEPRSKFSPASGSGSAAGSNPSPSSPTSIVKQSG